MPRAFNAMPVAAAWLPGRSLAAIGAGLLLMLAACACSWAWDAVRLLEAAQRLGPQALGAARALQSTVAAAAALDEPARLQLVNEFYNRRIVFRDDAEIWGVVDHWASPLETLNKGQGDCEDFAIAKYFTLVASGMPSAKLRMVYVRAQIGGPGGVSQAHMVLAYYASPGAEPLILDNLISDLRPASRRPDLSPVFSFNTEGLWQGVGPASAGDPVARLSRWRELLGKVRNEGML